MYSPWSAASESVPQTVGPWYKDRRFLYSAAVLLFWFGFGWYRSVPPALWSEGFTRYYLPHGYYLWSYRHFAYSDILALYPGRDLFTHAYPYLQQKIEYPVVMGWFMWTMAWAPGILGYFAATGVALAAAAMATLGVLRTLAPRHYVWVALAPLWLVYGLLNWDVLGILTMVLAWQAYRRDRIGLTGLYLGLGTATKLFPIIILPFMGVHLLTRKRSRPAALLALTTLGTEVALNAPFMLLAFHNWSQFFRYNADRAPSGDLWVLLWPSISSRQVDLWSLVLVAVVFVICITCVLTRRWSPEAGAAWTFLAWMFVNKVFSPQYMLWIIVFGALAEWPVWAFVSLWVGGLTDDVNSFLALRYHTAYPVGAPLRVWYHTVIYPIGAFVRYASMLVAAVVGLSYLGRTVHTDPNLWGRRAGSKTV